MDSLGAGDDQFNMGRKIVTTYMTPLPSAARWRRAAGLLTLVGLAAAAQWVLSHRGLPTLLATLPGLERMHERPGWVGLALYALALAVLWALLSDRSIDIGDQSAQFGVWKEGALVLAVMALAAWARLYRLEEMPPGLELEEARMARRVLELIHGARPWPWQMAEPGMTWAYGYYMSLFYRLLGPGYLTIKLPAVVGSVLAVIPLYLLAREMMRPAAAAAVIVLYATSRWGINVARWGQVHALTPFFASLALWLTWRTVHTGRWRYWITGGLTMGLSQYGDPSMRAIPIVITLFILWRALSPRGYLARHWRAVWLFYGLALLVWAPLGWSLATEPPSSVQLEGPVSFLEDVSTTAQVRQQLAWTPETAWRNLLAYAQAFHYRGDIDPRRNLVGAPQLEGITAALLVIGLGYAVARARRPGPALLLIWCGAFLAIGAWTPDAPDSLSVYGLLPALLLLCGLALDVLWHVWEQADPLSAEHLASMVVLAVVTWAGLDGTTTYFNRQGWQPGTWEAFHAAQTQAALYLRRVVGPTNEALTVSPPVWHVILSRGLFGSAPVEVINPGLATQRLSLADHVPLLPDVTGDVIYLVEPGWEPVADLLQRYYPESWRELVRSPLGNPLFTALVVPAEATARRGLRASFWAGTMMAGQPIIELPIVDALANLSVPLPLSELPPAPYAERLTGGLRITQAGSYRFRLGPSVGKAWLYLNDTLVASTEETAEGSATSGLRTRDGIALWLPEGVIPLRLERVISETTGLPPWRVEWLPPGAEAWSPLPSDRLLPITPPGGLVAAYYESDRFWGQPARLTLDPLLLSDSLSGGNAYAVRWLGALDAEQPGQYWFRLRAGGAARLSVGRHLVVDDRQLGDFSERVGAVSLDAGRVPLEIHYAGYGDSDTLEIEWLPPGGTWQPLRQATFGWDQANVMQAWSPLPASSLVAIPAFAGGPVGEARERLGELAPVDWLFQDERWPDPQRGANFQGRLLKVSEVVYNDGIGAFGPGELVFDLQGGYTRLQGAAGVDRDTIGDGVAWFEVELDGRVIWESGPRSVYDPALSFDLDVRGGNTLVLRTREGEPAGSSDAVDWVNLHLIAR